MIVRRVLATSAIVVTLSCGGAALHEVAAGMGPAPVLPPPNTSLLPSINVVKAIGWGEGESPTAAPGLVVRAFASGLDHPRWLHVLPNGDVLVAETNAPPRPDDATGIRGWFFKRLQSKAGGAVPSADRITLLRDTDGDGVADFRTTLVRGLHSPFGMAMANGVLFIANTDAVVRVPYRDGDTVIVDRPVKVADLPAGARNHHWTKSLIASHDGRLLYVGVGSNSNAAENGMEEEDGRAAIWEIDTERGEHRTYASGLRNPVGLAWMGDVLWVAVNERDELGPDLVPDYMTAVRRGGFYGWPWSYFGQVVDTRVKPRRPDLVATAIIPDYALGPHTASLGLASADSTARVPPFGDGMFVGQHGSWNRKPFSGYKVIFVPFIDGRPTGDPRDVLTGFLAGDGRAHGRPVGVAIDARGGLLVADDVGNTVWRVVQSSGSGR